MPGIVGIVSEKLNKDGLLLNEMLKSLNHLDYKISQISKDHLHFGNVHLGYINTTNSFYSSPDKRYLVSFAGEIFSYKNIETSQIGDDQAFFLTQFITEGTESFKWFNGHFCAAIYDFVEEKLYLVSDRMGTRPLYFALFENSIVFAPEIKAILKSGIKREIDENGISDLFRFSHVFGNNTLFKGINQLPEASYLVYSKNSCNTYRYWNFPEYADAYSLEWPNKRKVNDFEDELIAIFSNAMKRNFTKNSDKILISLSGGLDSRYVAAFAKSLNVNPLVSFTMGPDDSEDQKYSRLVASQLGMEHNQFVVKPQKIWTDAEKFAYYSDYMSMIYGPIQGFEALEHFYRKTQITVSSQMCDALFGSTLSRRKIKALTGKDKFDEESKNTLLNHFRLFDDSSLKQVFSNEFYSRIKDNYKEIPQRYINSTNYPIHAYFNLLINEHVRRGTLSGNLMNNLFMETRMPSFDNDLIDFTYRLPLKLKEYQYLYRRAFTRLYPELAKINRQHYNIPIDASNLRYRLSLLEIKGSAFIKSTKFAPLLKPIKKYNRPSYNDYNQWFKHDLHKEMVNIVLDKKTLSREIFNSKGIEQLVSLHQNPQNNYSRLLWQIINLEYFYKNYID